MSRDRLSGWRQRGWYLGEHRDRIVDSAGNAAPTARWDGRVVGTRQQDDHGIVVSGLFGDVGTEAHRRLHAQAERVTAFCDGIRVVIHPASSTVTARTNR